MVGEHAQRPQAKDVVRPEVPTCGPSEPIGEAWRRTQAAGWNVCLVVNGNRVVLGRLRREIWQAPADTPAEQVMENGPATIRPDELLEQVVPRMQKRNVESIVVSDADGVLMGVVYRSEAEARLASFSTS